MTSSRFVILSRLFQNTKLSVGLSSTMSAFVSHVNPVTGKTDWIMQDENYDYHQEIARSAYADMLHDTERNQKYYEALKKTIGQLHSTGKEAHVLDIGTGTGLLSMMSVAAGADSVTACEAFHPMAECARNIMKQNKFGEKIHLVPKRSTEMTVGPAGDMTRRANVLVTEVFDTELIGEGAIGTFNHAHKHLLEADCFVIPRAATMYVQPVCSDFVRRWNQIDASHTDLLVPESMTRCGGAPSLHDLQLDQIPTDQFTPLSDPLKVFRFDFNTKEGLEKTRQSEVAVKAASAGRVDAVFMWWDCEMDPQGEITLSCAPRWAHPDGGNLPWRDHWMQAIYYPSTCLSVSQGENFNVVSCHDEYSLWFDVCKERETTSVSERPMCTCKLHTTVSRSRIGMLGDPKRVDTMTAILNKHVSESSVCLCVSDGSLLPVMAAKCGAKKVFVVEPNIRYRRITESFLQLNKLTDRITILDKEPGEITPADINNLKIDVVIGEPYFASSLLPWHNMCMWYTTSDIAAHLAPNVAVLPGKLVMKAMAMNFDHLWKIRAPVGVCEGFDLAEFDKLVEGSAAISDCNVEPQPLWEYSGTALSPPVQLLSLEYPHFKEQTIQATGQLNVQTDGCLNGVAVWTEFDFGDGHVISSGPRRHVTVGETVEWDCYTQQGVHLIPSPQRATSGSSVTFHVHFNPHAGEFDFTFKT